MSRRCVFLDRDGVINRAAKPGDYIRSWDQFEFLPNITDWIRLFNELGYLVIVVTNQRGVASGLMDLDTVEDMHRRMIEQLAEAGARIDDVFCCPHAADSCDCRKPLPGLVQQACRKWEIDLDHSLLIGDSWRDEELARNCGVRFLGASGDGHLRPPAVSGDAKA